MDETLWELFWTTGLPEAYAWVRQEREEKEAGAANEEKKEKKPEWIG